jgi:hypothetical protein
MCTQTHYDKQCRPVTKQYIPVLHSQTVMPNNAVPLQTVPRYKQCPAVNTRFEQYPRRLLQHRSKARGAR